MNYDWKIVNRNTKLGTLDIQVDFKEPEYVSSNIDYDKIQFSIVDPNFYRDPKGKIDQAMQSVDGDIIRQIDENTRQVEVVKKTTFFVKAICIVIFLLVFVFFVALSDGDDPYLWSFLDTMQLLTHLQLINVKLPAVAAIFLNWVGPIFRFDYIKGNWMHGFFGLRFHASPIPVF